MWRDTGRDLERHTLVIGCPGPRLEYLWEQRPLRGDGEGMSRWLLEDFSEVGRLEHSDAGGSR